MTIDQDKLGELLGAFVTDLGATIAAGNIVVGHRLGLYRSLADAPATAEQLAQRTGTDPRYVAEWLRGQAAGGYVSYDPAGEQFSLTAEQAYALADPDGPLYLPGAFVLALGTLRAESQITDAFRTGAGMGWHEHHEDVFSGCEMFFRPGYVANLTSSWIPALDGVADKLAAGGRVADVGGPAYPAGARRGGQLADRRAAGRRHARRQPQPRRPCLLLVLLVLVRAERPLAARRVRPGRPGRRGRHPPGGRAGRFQPVPPGRRNTVQRRLRSAALTAGYAEAMANSGHPATAAFLKELQSICTSEPQFRNLDVRSAQTY